jgi:hypothetical protein
MPPSTSNPIIIASYVVGFILAIPVLLVLIRAIAFIVTATNKLDSVVTDVGQLKADVSSLRHSAGNDSQSVEFSLYVIETDINALQDKAGLPKREYPDRRVGPSDRRVA